MLQTFLLASEGTRSFIVCPGFMLAAHPFILFIHFKAELWWNTGTDTHTSERREANRSFICWFSPQIPEAAVSGPGLNWKPRTQSKSLLWVAGSCLTHLLLPPRMSECQTRIGGAGAQSQSISIIHHTVVHPRFFFWVVWCLRTSSHIYESMASQSDSFE